MIHYRRGLAVLAGEEVSERSQLRLAVLGGAGGADAAAGLVQEPVDQRSPTAERCSASTRST